MDKYIDYLEEQFKQATNTKNTDHYSEAYVSEMIDWLKKRAIDGERFLELLDHMKLYNLFTYSGAEIGKGQFDSIMINYDNNLITPYSEDLETLDKNVVITAQFKIYGGIPTIIRSTKSGIIYEEFKRYFPVTIMTHNPYTKAHIDNWDQVHNKGDNNIIVGVFGKNYDKDKDQKIKELKELRDKLNGAYQEEYITNHGTYCYVIASEEKKLIKK